VSTPPDAGASLDPDAPLGSDWFARPTLDVARELVGCRLVRMGPGVTRRVGRIVETEGYLQDDPAFHGWNAIDHATGLLKPEGRGRDLFVAPGRAYVYKIYGRYWLLNVVTEPEGIGGAVLIRAVEPVEGVEAMFEGRPNARGERDLGSGPGKLTQAMEIGASFHGAWLTRPPLFFLPPDRAAGPLAVTTRIGLTRGVELEYRFFERDNPHVSPGTPSDIAAARRRKKKGVPPRGRTPR
jgi:DNA-3-methyladenine glycosylase